ncbi:Sugar phosphate isomerase/epimerase, partial [Dysosmobacter welbionis]
VRGGGEQCLRPAELHQIPQQEKRRVVGDTGGLLHIVGHHDDSILAFQFHCKVFDLGGGDGVQGAGGLIHQQDLRLHCQGTGNAQPLLLAAGEAQGTLLQPVLHLVPDGGGAERVLHDLVQLGPGADAVGPGAVGHVVIDAHREGIGLLEHHADLLAQPGGVHIGGVDVLPGVVDLPLNADARYQVIHPVQGLQKGGLSAAGGADQGGDLMLRNVDIHTVEGMVRPVPQIQVLYLNDGGHFVSSSSVFLQLPAHQIGGQVDDQRQQHQNGGDGEGDVCLAPLTGIHIQGHGQCGGGGFQRSHKVIEHQAEAG